MESIQISLFNRPDDHQKGGHDSKVIMSSSEDSNEADAHRTLMESIPASSKQSKQVSFVDPLKGLITSSSGDERKGGRQSKPVSSIITHEEEKKLPDLHECLEDSESIFNLAPTSSMEESPVI